MKAIWTGAIGFGLVNIPIKLYSATEESNLDLDMLDKKDLAPIKFKRVNENSGKEVEWGNIVKAFDLDGKYIVLTDEDFEQASPEKSKLLTIDQFVNESEIDSIYYETPYYLEPQKNGEAAYSLLLDALKKSKKIGIGNFVMRSKEALGVLRPYEDILVFQRIRYAQEIRSYSELNIPKKTTKPAEMKMAIALIDQLSTKFDIGSYKDEYAAALMKLIKSKAKGTKSAAPKMKVVHSTTNDLMAQLKESLANPKSRKTAS